MSTITCTIEDMRTGPTPPSISDLYYTTDLGQEGN